MSGIVGIINRNGQPINPDLLQRMTDFMSYRGPDSQQIWVNGNVGFGHTMLRTTKASLEEKQPFNLDGIWITADARIDGREELIEKLKINPVTDVELILRAYQVWGEDCVQYLLGDFAFAIWDEREQKLFCARDHFGVKPFYYAEVGNCLIFSNTLNCLRIHPGVSDELNERAIADFLLFGYNQELTTTTFANIQRLPPAHCLTWSKEKLQIKRYWTLPTDGFIRYKKAEDYVEKFKELLEKAVNDRLGTNRVSIGMTGGLDSTTIAATTRELLSKQFDSFDLRAFTIVYDRLIPDRERYYSKLVAETLGIPIQYLVADDYQLFEGWEKPELHQPEPMANPLLAISLDHIKQMADHSRVALKGSGGDPILYPSGSYFFTLLKSLRWGELLTAVGWYFRTNRRLPPVGLRTQLKRSLKLWHPKPYPNPKWLHPELVTRLDLPARWDKLVQERLMVHPTRSEAYQTLTSSNWPCLFEFFDPGVTGYPVEIRYPFLDLRLVDYLLAIPPIPWFVHKELVRVAMQGILPEEVRLRPKTTLAGDPVYELLQQPATKWIDQFESVPDLAKYVNRDMITPVSGMNVNAYEAWINLRPICLNYWLKNLKPVKYQLEKEVCYEI